ncbi:MAG: vWA domain-containing protein [Myxococcota bacterium]
MGLDANLYDPAEHARVARDVARPANQLRNALVDLGLAFRTVRPRTRGHRIDRGRFVTSALRRDPRILISRVRVPTNDLFVGVCVDCSGSMNGERMERARQFATLLAVACQGLPSVDLRTFGFTDSTLYDAGTASRSAAHALRAGGGNNDAAALHHVAGLARRSPRDAKLLVMISDGLPTECSSTSLIALVKRLEREGMACAQVAVARIREPCFDHYVEVLGADSSDVVRRFGRIVQGLVAATLRGSR